MAEPEADQLRTLNAILRIAARHTSLLQREAFEELCAVVSEAAPFGSMGVTVAEDTGFWRVYSVSTGSRATFGGRIPIADHPSYPIVFVEGRPYVCEDTRLSPHALDQSSASDGFLSYLGLPVRVGAAPGRVAASLFFAYRTAGGAGAAPRRLLEQIATVLGQNLERALPLARERRLAMILATSGDAMLAWDRDGRITDANEAASILSGRGRRDLIGASIEGLLEPVPDLSQPSSRRQGTRLELLSRDGAGASVRVTVAATVTQVDDDPQVAAHALLRDLSSVVAAERDGALRLARIRELEEQHRTLLDNAPLIIFRLDPVTTELVYLNRHAERLLGVPTAEAMGTAGFLRSAHSDADGVANFDAAIARAREGDEAQPYEARMRRRGGGEITVRGTVYPLLAEGGELVAVEGVLADVSTEHAARTRLVQADRLSTLGTLSAGVAHEINNPAAFILLGLDMLARIIGGSGVKMEPGPAKSAEELLGELRDSIKRIVDIARDLRLFASPPPSGQGRRTVVDVNRTVESALTLTRGQIIDRAEIEQRLDEVPPVLMDDGRLGQVVVNLLVNAAQAIPKAYAKDNRVSIVTRSDGRNVEIEVTDTGLGIDAENLGRIWTPFFTTKGADTGTGLGLSISREIVERAGGRIEALSPVFEGDPPFGARFTIVLPAAGRGDSVTPISSPLPKIPSQRARVLVVEDEALLARALADEIGRVHHVSLAEGAERARELLSAERFDVVLCDLRMPGMSGEALYGEIAGRDPAQAGRFVFMTGVGFGADVERFLGAAGRPILEKPFPMDLALTTIAKVMASAPSSAPSPPARPTR